MSLRTFIVVVTLFEIVYHIAVLMFALEVTRT